MLQVKGLVHTNSSKKVFRRVCFSNRTMIYQDCKICYFKSNSTIKPFTVVLWNRTNIFPNLQHSFPTQTLQKNQTQKGAISHLHVYFSSSVAYCSSIITIILYLQGQTFKHSCHWRWHSLLRVKIIKIFKLFKFPHRTSAFLFQNTFDTTFISQLLTDTSKSEIFLSGSN